jgi:hypothetical protein
MYKKNVFIKLIIVILFTSTTALGQVKNYGGSIVDIFDNALREVLVTNERTLETVISSCKGKFSIKANKGDQLTFTKENYLLHRQLIKSGRKMAILLNFDSQLIQSKIYLDVATLHDYETPMDDAFCQPLFVIDGEPFNSDNRTGRFLNLQPEEVSKVNVLRGRSATEMLGNAAGNGVIFIHTKCNYPSRSKFPAAYEE